MAQCSSGCSCRMTYSDHHSHRTNQKPLKGGVQNNGCYLLMTLDCKLTINLISCYCSLWGAHAQPQSEKKHSVKSYT